MKLGSAKDVASLGLLLLGALLVLGALARPLVEASWSIADILLGIVFGLALWRAGKLIRRGVGYGYPLAAAILLLSIGQPYLRGHTLPLPGAVILLVLLGLVLLAWWRTRGAPVA
jgi:hypothetical protein